MVPTIVKSESHIFEIIIVIVMIVLIVGAVIWLILAFRAYRTWVTNENPRCPTINCGQDSANTDAGCTGTVGDDRTYPAYRKKDDGTIQCQSTMVDPWLASNLAT